MVTDSVPRAECAAEARAAQRNRAAKSVPGCAARGVCRGGPCRAAERVPQTCAAVVPLMGDRGNGTVPVEAQFRAARAAVPLVPLTFVSLCAARGTVPCRACRCAARAANLLFAVCRSGHRLVPRRAARSTAARGYGRQAKQRPGGACRPGRRAASELFSKRSQA